MLKVKVFRFRVSNAASGPLKGDEHEEWFIQDKKELVSEKSIEETINKFIEDKDVVDIKINNIDVRYHNNARGNTIDLVYTIMYKE